jgi:hypothetical protein
MGWQPMTALDDDEQAPEVVFVNLDEPDVREALFRRMAEVHTQPTTDAGRLLLNNGTGEITYGEARQLILAVEREAFVAGYRAGNSALDEELIEKGEYIPDPDGGPQ